MWSEPAIEGTNAVHIYGTIRNLSALPLKNIRVASSRGSNIFTLFASSQTTAPANATAVVTQIAPHAGNSVSAILIPPAAPSRATANYGYRYYGQPQTPEESDLWQVAADLNARRGKMMAASMATGKFAIVYAEIDNPTPAAALAGEKAIEHLWEFIRALVDLHDQEGKMTETNLPQSTLCLPAGPSSPPTSASAPALPHVAPAQAAGHSDDRPDQTLWQAHGVGSTIADPSSFLGDVFGFIGPNGAGKSTTMKILTGLLEPTSGQARILGKLVSENGDFVRRNVGYMPDSFGVYDDLKVSEYLEFFASAYHVPRLQRKRVVADVLELTDLKYKQDAFVDSLSRGMQQRLGLARVLVHDPPVLLLDEPASGLDPRARIEIRELLKELQRLGKTIMVSSHILSELGEFCNKLGIIERGKLLVVGTIDELIARARATSAINVQVIGDPEQAANILRADPRITGVERTNGQLMVHLQNPDLHHAFIIERLVSRGVAIHSVTPEQVKLEDVFLRLTKGIVQ